MYCSLVCEVVPVVVVVVVVVVNGGGGGGSCRYNIKWTPNDIIPDVRHYLSAAVSLALPLSISKPSPSPSPLAAYSKHFPYSRNVIFLRHGCSSCPGVHSDGCVLPHGIRVPQAQRSRRVLAVGTR